MSNVCDKSGSRRGHCRYCSNGVCRFNELFDHSEDTRHVLCQHVYVPVPDPEEIHQRCQGVQNHWPAWLEELKRRHNSKYEVPKAIMVNDGMRRNKDTHRP